MILVIGSIRTSRQSFSKLVGNGSRSLEVIFDFMITSLTRFLFPKSKYSLKKLCQARDARFGIHYFLAILSEY